MTLRIVALAAHHDRHNFDCGEPALNAFLQRQANQLNRKGFGKTYVALADDGVTVVGFVTVSAGQATTEKLPVHHKLPSYPATVLRVDRLAVDIRAQGRGIGQQLMAFALRLAFDFSKQVGLYAVIVDARHDKARVFYEGLGFSTTLDDPLCLFLPVAMLQMVHRDGP